MSLKTFLWDKTLAIVFNITGAIAVSVFTGMTEGTAEAAVIAAAWIFTLILYCAVSYFLLRRRIVKIQKTAYGTEDKFLLSEIAPKPQKSEDSLYYELMILQGRAAIDKVTRAEKEKSEYRDYLQQWVHEIKTPIAAAGLICSNNKGEAFQEILGQLGKINNYAEQVLYETKSNNIEKDLFIKETDVASVVNGCIKENKQLFIDSGIKITVAGEGTVFTDEKWLGFILKQILYNCVQYRRSENARIEISAGVLSGDKLVLSVRDNGIGILESELPRIFEKGFTGSNGRRNKKSTGLGLYLCKKLCRALDIDISAESGAGEYTKISLSLPYKVVRCG